MAFLSEKAEPARTLKTVVRFILLCAMTAGIAVHPALAALTAASEYQVKAAFLYNFIKFVEWPPKAFPDRNSPVIIGIFGDDPFFDSAASTNYLEQMLEGKAFNDRKIVVQRSDRIANLENSHLIFISKSARNRIKDVLESLNGLNILVVGETENFCQAGGTINFVMQSEKVRFEINVGAAEKAGLKISSKLLSVAKIVSTQTQ